MYKRASSPKGEVLEAIAIEWPEYAQWLISGLDQYEPTSDIKRSYKFIGVADARFMDRCIVKPESMSRLVLIQNPDNENELSGMITIDDRNGGFVNRAILIQEGNINFASRHGGKLALQVFRKWLNDKAPHLLSGCEIKFIDIDMDNVDVWDHVLDEFMYEIDESNDENEMLLSSFSNWVSGAEDW